MAGSPLRVFVVVDDPGFLDYIHFFLSKQGSLVFPLSDGEEALRRIDELQPDLVILDVTLNGLGGFETLELMKAGWPELPVLMLTCHDRVEAGQATRLGADGFMRKPWVDGEFEVVLAAKIQACALKKGIDAREGD